MGQIYSVYTQAFPPPPTFIEKDIGDLQGKVSGLDICTSVSNQHEHES